MSIFKDAGDSLLKYGEMIVNKTEEYSKIAKLNVEIKKIEWDIDRICKEMGKLLITKLENNETMIESKENDIQELYTKFKDLKEAIAKKKNEIEIIKKTRTHDKKQDSEKKTSEDNQA